MAPPFMDVRIAPVNPCSLETVPIPIRLANGRSVWPMMLSCYELSSSSVVSPLSSDTSLASSSQQQPASSSKAESEASHRVGYMDLSFITVPDDMAHKSSAMPLQFDPHPYVVAEHSNHHDGGGILDGQWSTMQSYMINDSTKNPHSYCFATAHSTGEIQLHAIQAMPSDNEEMELWKIQFMGHCASTKATFPTPLCLSLRWDHPAPYQKFDDPSVSSNSPARLVSTYSNGTVAIHDVTVSDEISNEEGAIRPVQLIERDRWNAHTLFSSSNPAEVWSAAFVESQVVWSGGDDAAIKVWDVRATTRPMLTLLDPFEAGVTCISPHPTQSNIVAVGSYDENISLMDTRYMGRSRPLWKSGKLGGGIWRMKWHPYTANRMLVGAMHAGCCVLDFHGTCLDQGTIGFPSVPSSFDEDDFTVKCTKKFAEHESMVYGGDWLVCPHPTRNGYFEAAASCSFYDRAVYIWDSV